MSESRRRILQNVAILGLSTLVAVGLAEGLLRLFPDLLSPEARTRIHWRELATTRLRSEAHPYLGFLYPPFDTVEVRRRDFGYTYGTDGHGFRNPWPWPDTAQVVVLGDSQAFGFGVEDEQMWARLLDERLGGARVVTLGINGYAPQQYKRTYELFGAGLQPRVVVLNLFPGNDIRGAALFDRWENAGSPGNYDVWRFFDGQPPGEGGLRRALERSYLVNLLSQARKNFGSPFSSRTITFEDGGQVHLAPGLLDANVELMRPGRPEFKRVVEVIEEARSLVVQDGAQLLVLLTPTKEEVYLPLLGEPAPPGCDVVAEELARRGIPHLDLTPHFQARGLTTPHFLAVDGHPNPEGHRLIAGVVASELTRLAPELGAPHGE